MNEAQSQSRNRIQRAQRQSERFNACHLTSDIRVIGRRKNSTSNSNRSQRTKWLLKQRRSLQTFHCSAWVDIMNAAITSHCKAVSSSENTCPAPHQMRLNFKLPPVRLCESREKLELSPSLGRHGGFAVLQGFRGRSISFFPKTLRFTSGSCMTQNKTLTS